MNLRLLLFCTISLAILAFSYANDAPPKAAVHEVEDDYWGIKIKDPYRWLENVDHDPEAQQWVKAQADFTTKTLSSLQRYQTLKALITELSNSEPAKIARPRMLANGEFFYLKTASGQNTAKLYFRESTSADEVLLVDPDQFAKQDGKPRAINFYEPSWDGSHVVYGISALGSEDASIHIITTATGKESNEIIPRCEDSSVSWLPDGRHFVYTQLQELKPGQPPSDKYMNISTRFHEVGSDPQTDPVYLASGSNPTVRLAPQQSGAIVIVPGCDFCFAVVNNFVENELRLYAARLEDLGPKTQWTPLCDLDDQVTSIGFIGANFYFLTHKDAPKFKIIARTFSDGHLSPAKEIVPETCEVIRQMISAKDGIYYTASDGATSHLYRISTVDTAKPTEIKLPYPGWASFYGFEDQSGGNLQATGVLLNLTSWIRASAYYKYDPEHSEMVHLALQPEGPYDQPQNLIAEELTVKSYDGTEIPLSVQGLKTFKKDGTHPVLLSGYGAYGIVDEPYYFPTQLAALEHGMWLATAHVRGGGIAGDSWHRAGMKATKPNTWKDFIACGEYLIQHGYAAKDKLTAIGGSAGGILIGRAVTERPDLFAAACPIVGALDMLRAENTPNGPPNIPEFGTVKIKDEFEALLAMSTYQHIVPGTKYPALLFYHGFNDPRVPVWMSAKAAARFQAATSSGKPVLLDIDYESGHGIGSTQAQLIRRRTDVLAFLLWQVGDPNFQPTTPGR
jgi:prolyl oligopeptidase